MDDDDDYDDWEEDVYLQEGYGDVSEIEHEEQEEQAQAAMSGMFLDTDGGDQCVLILDEGEVVFRNCDAALFSEINKMYEALRDTPTKVVEELITAAEHELFEGIPHPHEKVLTEKHVKMLKQRLKHIQNN